MAVDGMVEDMKSVTKLVQSQVKAGMKEDDVTETMCRSWIGRLQQQHGLRDQHKSALTDAISEGPWTDQQKKLLASTVLASGVKASRKAADRRPNQKSHNIESLLPVECMSNLRDAIKYSLISRLSILARSVKALGIENPDNITLFRLVCIVAYCDPKLSFDQADTWRHMTTLQKYIKAGGNSTVQYIVDYPPSSALLPQDIQKSAYGSSGLPPELDWRELDHILADQKARGDRHVQKNKSSSSNVSKKRRLLRLHLNSHSRCMMSIHRFLHQRHGDFGLAPAFCRIPHLKLLRALLTPTVRLGTASTFARVVAIRWMVHMSTMEPHLPRKNHPNLMMIVLMAWMHLS